MNASFSADSDRPQSFRARWVFPVDGLPFERGVIEIADGRIAAVHNRPGPVTADLGNVALIPGLVNAHTHLELSDVPAPLEPRTPFHSWLESVLAHRRSRPGAEAMRQAVRSGAAESLQAGTTFAGDIVSADWTPPEIGDRGPGTGDREGSEPEPRNPKPETRPVGLSGVAFLELLGLRPERIPPQLELAERHLQSASLTGRVPLPLNKGEPEGVADPVGTSDTDPSKAGNRRESKGPERSLSPEDVPQASSLKPQASAKPHWIPGISPHAPYSVHPELFAKLVDLAAAHGAPLAMHLAETRAELELLADGTGDFVPFLERLGVWRPDVLPRGSRPLDYLRRMAKVPCALAIHGNYFGAAEIDFLAECPNISVVYCPRTHAWFGHAPHPWATMLERGINVAIGTDSRASTPDLSVWHELQFLRAHHPDMPPAVLLELGTRRGARALGRDADFGRLIPGLAAELTLIALPQLDSTDPYELLFHPASHVT